MNEKEKKCAIEPHLQIPGLSCEEQRGIFFEVEEDAWIEAGDRKGALELVKDPKWIKGEVHDIAKRHRLITGKEFTDEQREKLQEFLNEYFK